MGGVPFDALLDVARESRAAPVAVLQLSKGAGDLPQWALIGLVALELVTIAVGLFIAYTAYRGYRRNDSRPMLFIAVGFLLVLGAPTVLGSLLLAVPAFQSGTPRLAVSFAIQVAEIAGFASILYALRMRP